MTAGDPAATRARRDRRAQGLGDGGERRLDHRARGLRPAGAARHGGPARFARTAGSTWSCRTSRRRRSRCTWRAHGCMASYPAMPLGESCALSIACTSLGGTMAFGLTADWDALPDIDVLARGIETVARRARRRQAGPSALCVPPLADDLGVPVGDLGQPAAGRLHLRRVPRSGKMRPRHVGCGASTASANAAGTNGPAGRAAPGPGHPMPSSARVDDVRAASPAGAAIAPHPGTRRARRDRPAAPAPGRRSAERSPRGSIEGSAVDHPVARTGRPAPESIRRIRAATNRSPTPGRVVQRERRPSPPDAGSHPRPTGTTEQVSTSPATDGRLDRRLQHARSRRPSSSRTTITRPVPSSAMNRETIRRSSIRPEPRPSRGDQPKPGRSSARTRPGPPDRARPAAS